MMPGDYIFFGILWFVIGSIILVNLLGSSHKQYVGTAPRRILVVLGFPLLFVGVLVYILFYVLRLFWNLIIKGET